MPRSGRLGGAVISFSRSKAYSRPLASGRDAVAGTAPGDGWARSEAGGRTALRTGQMGTRSSRRDGDRSHQEVFRAECECEPIDDDADQAIDGSPLSRVCGFYACRKAWPPDERRRLRARAAPAPACSALRLWVGTRPEEASSASFNGVTKGAAEDYDDIARSRDVPGIEGRARGESLPGWHWCQHGVPSTDAC